MANKVVTFDDAERARINRAVQDAESTTGAEIVPVVAQCSGRYDRAEDLVGLGGAALALVVAWMLFPVPQNDPTSWGGPHPVWQLVALLAAAFVGFACGAVVAGRVVWLRRPFVPLRQMQDEVLERAYSVFFDKRVHHTLNASGVLLYVSLFERRAAIIADQTVLEKLGQDRLEELCRDLTKRLGETPCVDALCESIAEVGRVLAPLLPSPAGDANELPDALIANRSLNA